MSSLRDKSVEIYDVYEYLLNISRLSYTKVDLHFLRRPKEITNIQRNDSTGKFGDENYEFNVVLWQVFKGYQDGVLIYGDATQKTIQIEYKKHNSKSSMKIRYIRVRHTETTEKEKQLREIYGN